MTPRIITPLLALSALAGPLAAQARFVPLGSLTPRASSARGVDADGSVVVGFSNLLNGSLAFRWSATTGMVALGDFPGGGDRARATAVSADGAVVVGHASSTAQFEDPFRWTATTGMVSLGMLPNGLAAEARAVDADGDVIVGSGSFTTPVPGAALRWTPAGGLTQLLPDATASGVDADGDVVVGHARFGSAIRAFRWTAAGGAVSLGHIPGFNSSNATAVTPDGRVVVGISGSRAFRWTAATGMVDLGSGPLQSGCAYGVSGDGNTIVGLSEDPNVAGGVLAVIWTPATGMISLKDHLVSLGASGLSGWDLIEANAISVDGNAIVGMARGPGSSFPEAYVAYLEPPAFPIGERYCSPATPNSTGQPGSIGVSGSVVVFDDDVTLRAESLPPNQFGIFLVAPSRGFVAGPGGSQGDLCLAGHVGRYSRPGEVGATGSAGAFELVLDLANTPSPTGAIAIAALETWHFQCWHRDTLGGSNFTDAVEVAFR